MDKLKLPANRFKTNTLKLKQLYLNNQTETAKLKQKKLKVAKYYCKIKCLYLK